MTRNNIVKNVCSAFIARSGEVKSGRSFERDMDGFFHGAATAFHEKGLVEEASAIAGFIAFELPKGYSAIESAAKAPVTVEERVGPTPVPPSPQPQKVSAARA